jgi:dolichyl-phosphate beta-glucosyltransferase
MTRPDSTSGADSTAPLLSIVIPTFNEAGRIEETLLQAYAYLQQAGITHELIVVDNSSTDGTAELVARIAGRTVPSIRLFLESCRGKGAAVKHGVLQSHGKFVVFMDADNATPASEIERFWAHWRRGCGVVIGSRYLKESLVNVPQRTDRIVLSRVGNAIIRLLLLPGVYDTQIGFKGFTGELARELFRRLKTEGWAFDVELLVMARRAGHRICEVPVRWSEPGGSHLPVTAYFSCLIDVLRVTRRAWSGHYDVPRAAASRAVQPEKHAFSRSEPKSGS